MDDESKSTEKEEIRFTYTGIRGLYECSKCGSGVINIEVHRSAHEAGTVV